jgi:hypothetical protein
MPLTNSLGRLGSHLCFFSSFLSWMLASNSVSGLTSAPVVTATFFSIESFESDVETGATASRAGSSEPVARLDILTLLSVKSKELKSVSSDQVRSRGKREHMLWINTPQGLTLLHHPYVLPIANSGYKIEVWMIDRLISMSRLVLGQGRRSFTGSSLTARRVASDHPPDLIPSCSAELLIPPSIMEFMHKVLYDVDKDV